MTLVIDSEESSISFDDSFYRSLRHHSPTSTPSPSPPPFIRKKSSRSSQRSSHHQRSSSQRTKDRSASVKRKSTRIKREKDNNLQVPQLNETPPEKINIRVPSLPPSAARIPQTVQSVEKIRKDNIWSEVKNLKEQCSTRMELVTVITVAIIKDAGALILTTAVALCMITVGLIYITECPKCKFIPYYLLLTGILGIINQIFNYRIHRKSTDFLEDSSKDSVVLRVTFICLCFMVGCGSYWVLKIYQPNYIKNRQNDEEYCHKTVYLFAFWITIMIYVILLLVPFIWFLLQSLRNCILKKRKNLTQNSIENNVNIV